MIPRQVAVEYKVDRAGPDVEREQLNRILEEIKRQIANLGGDVNYVTQQQLQDALDTIVFPPSGGGIVETIVEGFAISVDATDPANPEVSVVPVDLISSDANNQLVIGVDGGLFVPMGGGGTVNVAGSIEGDGTALDPITLDGDNVSPGVQRYYGTNSAGVKGFHALATGLTTHHDRMMSLQPTGYWRLNESSGPTAFDSSGNGLHGTYIDAPLGPITYLQPSMIVGNADGCVHFGGASYVDLGQPLALELNTTTDSFTIFGIVDWDLVAPGSGIVVARSIDANRYAQIDAAANFPIYRVGGTVPTITNETARLVNAPMSVVLVLRRYGAGATVRMECYANGVYLNTQVTATPNNPSGIDWLIGARRGATNAVTTNYISGRLQSIAIFNRALSLPEVQSISRISDVG